MDFLACPWSIYSTGGKTCFEYLCFQKRSSKNNSMEAVTFIFFYMKKIDILSYIMNTYGPTYLRTFILILWQKVIDLNDLLGLFPGNKWQKLITRNFFLSKQLFVLVKNPRKFEKKITHKIWNLTDPVNRFQISRFPEASLLLFYRCGWTNFILGGLSLTLLTSFWPFF